MDSTGNYSGASSSSIYPPSLNGTSTSSASAGKLGWRNTPSQSSNSEREQLQYKSYNQHPNDYRYKNRGRHMYPKSLSSMENLQIYENNHDIAAMSDPGISRSERNHGQRNLQIEYARSEIPSLPSSYYDSQQRHRKSPRHVEEKRHQGTKPQYSQNAYTPAPLRRNSSSLLLEQQLREDQFRVQQNYYRDRAATNQDNYFKRANEGYHDGILTSSPSYNERSLGSSTANSAVNVKQLQRQLQRNNEFLKVQVPSSPNYYRRIQQSLSPTRQPPEHGLKSSSNNLPRFARSLSPRRRQYQHSSPIMDEDPSLVQKTSSTISETSYNNRFHSKFYEAALVAQKRVDDKNKAVVESDLEESRKHTQHYQHQYHRQRQFSPLQFHNEGNSNKHSDQNVYGKKSVASSSMMPDASSQLYAVETYKKATDHYVKNDNGVNKNTIKVGHNILRPHIIHSSASSSSPPTIPNDQRQERKHQKRTISVDRGRKGLPQLHRVDGRSGRRLRPPSPLLLERISTFDHDYCHEPAQGISECREQGFRSVNKHHDERIPNSDCLGINYHDNVNGNNSHIVVGDKNMSSRYIAKEENTRSSNVTNSRNPRSHDDGNNVDNGNGHSIDISPAINEASMQSGSHQQRRDYQLEGFDNEIGRDRMTNLVNKLSAINRENPENALAQIDSILRDESRSTYTKTLKNSHIADAKVDGKAQSQNKYITESNLSGRECQDGEGGDIVSNNDDDDESSDVSSITNPTYKQVNGRPYSSTQMEPLYIRENDHYNMHNTLQNNIVGETNDGDFNTFTYNPSTSSFRRPRPSHLQNYSKDVLTNSNTMSRSEWKKQQLKKYPPPSTINVKDDLVKNKGPRQNSADFREKMLQKNIQASRPNKNVEVSRELKTSMIVHGKPKKKLDRFIADKEGFAEKNRDRDESSNQLSSSRLEQEQKAKGHQSIGTFTKRHPWDSNIDEVQTKDTSMENAVGIEAEISRGHRYNSHTNMHDTEAENSVGDSGVSNEFQRNYVEEGIRNMNDGSLNKRSIDSNESEMDMPVKGRHPDISASDNGNSNLMPNIDVSVSGIPQFSPSKQRKYEDKGLGEKKSATKGSSWVAIPPSSYFPDVDDDFEPISSKKSRESNDFNELLGSEGSHEGINQVSAGFNKLNMQKEDGVTEFRSITLLSCKTIGSKEPKLKEKKRGFLRAFMEKKKTKASRVGYAASAAAASGSDHSASVESRGVRSASHISSKNRQKSTQSISEGNIRILPPPRGVLNQTKTFTDKDVRSRVDYQSDLAPTHRSKSAEKFRSSSMAQKFNRVMELYDSDEA